MKAHFKAGILCGCYARINTARVVDTLEQKNPILDDRPSLADKPLATRKTAITVVFAVKVFRTNATCKGLDAWHERDTATWTCSARCRPGFGDIRTLLANCARDPTNRVQVFPWRARIAFFCTARRSKCPLRALGALGCALSTIVPWWARRRETCALWAREAGDAHLTLGQPCTA